MGTIKKEKRVMENIYCTDCNTKIIIHADGSCACSCQGLINPCAGGDPIPDTWEMRGEDSDSVAYELCRASKATTSEE